MQFTGFRTDSSPLVGRLIPFPWETLPSLPWETYPLSLGDLSPLPCLTCEFCIRQYWEYPQVSASLAEAKFTKLAVFLNKVV